MSNIDPTKPTYGQALTSDVRQNFLYAKYEIEDLQASINSLPGIINNGVSVALSNYIPLSQKAQPIGVATLDDQGKLVSSQIPPGFTGTLNYRGGWNAATNTPVMASGALVGGVLQPAGNYYVVTVSGTTAAIDGVTTWVAGDWISSNGTIWQRVQNSTSPYLPLTGGVVTGNVTIPSITLSPSGDRVLPDNKMPTLAWGIYDSLGNIGPHIRIDGTAIYGTMSVKKFLPGTIDGSSVALSLASTSIAGMINIQSADPRIIGYPFRITDPTGNVVFAIDDAGKTHASLTSQNAIVTNVPNLTIGNVYSTPVDVRMPDTTYQITDAFGQGGIALTAGGHAAFTPAVGMISGPAQQSIKRKTILTQCSWNQSSTVYNEVTGTTFAGSMTLETLGFDAVRLIFASDNGPGAPFDTTISAKVAVSAQPNDYFNPIDPTGAAAVWTTVTFNNNGLDVDWYRQTTGNKTTQVFLPAPTISSMDGTAQGNLVTYTLSDWIPISSYDRTDAGGRWPILMLRMYGTGTVVRARQFPQSVNGFGAQVGDRFWRLHSALGDFITNPSTFPVPGTINGNTVLVGIQYYSRSRGISMLNIGDSIAGGTSGGPGGIDWAVRACLSLSTPQSPISYFIAPTGIITGTSPNVFMPNAELAFDFMRPSIVCMETLSRNWGVTQQHIDMLWQRYMLMTARLEGMGGLPVFSDPGPNSTMDVNTEPLRLQIVHRCVQAEQGGHFKQHNNDGELVTGSTPVDTFAPYYSDDNLHPNGRGHDAYAAALIKHILAAIGGTNP